MSFNIGDKILCIEDRGHIIPKELINILKDIPRIGHIYTIRNIFWGSFTNPFSNKIITNLTFHLEEIRNGRNPYNNIEIGFDSTRFIKLNKNKELEEKSFDYVEDKNILLDLKN